MQYSILTNCSIPVGILRGPPFNLTWGSSVFAKVSVINSYGFSQESVEGNGAIITTNPDAPTNLIEIYSLRTKSTLAFSWQPPQFTGGAPILDYRVFIAQQSGIFTVLALGVNSTEYTAVQLTAGITYQFMIESRNSYGYSSYSNVITLLCAFKPEAPTSVTTQNHADKIEVYWNASISNGSPIIAYNIYIMQSGANVFIQESIQCNNISQSVLENQQCAISLITLQTPPYSLIDSESVYAVVVAVNYYGSSEYSTIGNGGVIQLVPDAPINLQNDFVTTSDIVIRFTWSQGDYDGGSPILDYTIYYDQGLGGAQYIMLDSGITTQYYLTSITLIPGVTYQFKVSERNSVGSSQQSSAIAIVAAKLPDAPLNLVNVPSSTNATQVALSWNQGAYDGGSPILDYQVSFTESQSNLYSLFESGILTTNSIVTGLTPGVTYNFVVQARNVIGYSAYSTLITVWAVQVPDQPINLANVANLTNENQIGLSWQAPIFNGGTPVIDYQLWSDQATGSTFTLIESNVTGLQFTVLSLIEGFTYQFKVQARNAFGESEFSNIISVLAAQVPDQPQTPITVWNPDNVSIIWAAPDYGGSPILGYTVLIRESDLVTYSKQLSHCDMSISISTTCVIPVSVLRAAPFSLPWGSSVYVQVYATNAYGNSLVSNQGNGAVITTNPDPPINLVEDYFGRTKSTLALSWQPAPFTGGDIIIDYIISIAQLGESYSVLAQGVQTTSYTANNLISGITYQFQVQSRNSYGYSTPTEISLLCAFIPEAPTNIITTNNADKVLIQWTQSITNGSPITAYQVFIEQHGSVQYIQESVECNQNSNTIINSQYCYINLATLEAIPYSLVQGDSIYAEVKAINFYGSSNYSLTGNGAVIQLVPDAPINLNNDPNTTSDTVIRFTWSQGLNNGGTPVIDYTVFYDQGVNNFMILQSGVIENYYQTTIELIPGVTYSFKITARNTVGNSIQSVALAVLAAKIPDAPLNLINVPTITNANQIGLSWNQGLYNGGSQVIDYQISFAQLLSQTYTVYADGVTQTELTVIGLSSGETYTFVVKARNIIGQSSYSTEISILAAQIPDAPTSLQNIPIFTSASQIGLSWLAPQYDGGSPVIDYAVWSDQASGTSEFTIFAQDIITNDFNATQLIEGSTYQFKVKARNIYGYSNLYSNTVTILAAQIPAQPLAPVTYFQTQTSNVIISWTAPDNGGSNIISYTILIAQSDQTTFTRDLTNCDGSSQSILQSLTCTISAITLNSEPFNLPWGSSVYVIVFATNIYGDSLQSPIGNGAMIVRIPDAPVNLTEKLSDRTYSTLGITWSDGLNNGGLPIIEYQVTIVSSIVGYLVSQGNLVQQTYTATSLILGETYYFQVQARNSFGISPFSVQFSLICGVKPSIPTDIQTTNSGNNLIISWTASIQNGSPITSYQVTIKSKSGVYYQDLTNCDGSQQSVILTTTCTVPLSTLQQSPFLLNTGDQIIAQVSASNQFGQSSNSTPSGQAQIWVQPDPPVNLANNAAVTNINQIGLTWQPGFSNGGTSVIDYRLWYAPQYGTYEVLQTGISSTSYTTTIPITAGQNYLFKVDSRTAYGYSNNSAEVVILAAQQPNVPSSVQTQISGSFVLISWQAPYNGGSQLTSYTIQIQQSDGITYSQELTDCQGSSTIILQSAQCLVPISALITSPYNLSWGTSVYAKVNAINILGNSAFSEAGNGAIILTSPDAPLNLANNAAITSMSQVGLTWSQGKNNGGSSVIDYSLWYSTDNVNFSILKSGITSTSYTFTTAVTGTTYYFEVQARNSYGYSNYSSIVSVLAAQKPSKPQAPTTTWSNANSQVTVSWVIPSANGAPITSYMIQLRQSDNLTYTTESVYCTGATVVSSASCSIPVSVLTSSPYNLPWGYSVFAKVTASNLMGSSTQSNAGNGAVIVTNPSAPINLIENTSVKTATSIGLKWTQGSINGGATIVGYQISISQDGVLFTVLTQITGITSTSYTVTGLTSGITYTFVVQSKNSFGYSSYSNSVTILCAYIPNAPLNVQTSNLANQIVISWSSAVTNGSPITQYKVFIQQYNSNTYTQLVSTQCSSTSSSVIANASCTIYTTVITQAPFNLVLNDSVYVKIISSNIYGDSPYSTAGNGAIIWVQPDAPINLANNVSVTNANQIGLSWSQGISNGGTPVLDYQIQYAVQYGAYTILQTGVTQNSYTTTVQLQAGSYYQFKVASRTAYGYSNDSAQIIILAARIPDIPTSVSTTISGSNVLISWSATYNGGSSLTAYTIQILQSDGVTYSQDTTDCLSTSPIILSSHECTVPIAILRSSPFSLPWGSSIFAKVNAINIVGTSNYSTPGNGAVILTQPDTPLNLTYNKSISGSTQIALSWADGLQNGGSSIIDYRIWYMSGTSSFEIVSSGILKQSYNVTSLTPGLTYSFQVQSRNSYGYSNNSTVISVLAASVPNQPQIPTTQWFNANSSVNIAWNLPNNNGASITSYTIQISQSDNITYSTESIYCNSTIVVQQRYCSIPVAVLRAAPYNLSWGSSVFAKVTASNIIGNSIQSTQGNGAIIVTSPNPPTNLTENLAVKSATILGLIWTAPTFTGGVNILDYTIYQSTDGINYEVAAVTLLTQYQFNQLTPGVTYSFEIYSRNSFGYSVQSQVITLLCAYMPTTPESVYTQIQDSTVLIGWDLQSSNGSPITDYKVYIQSTNSGAYLQESIGCSGTSSDVISTMSCYISLIELAAEPFNLKLGESINAKVIATNLLGDSGTSDSGNGALMLLIPDAPLNLTNVATVSNLSTIEFTWVPGAADGGSPVLDYSVYYDQGIGQYVLIASGITNLNYQTDFNITKNVYYSFIVQARNQVGFSSNSQILTILSATIPDQPIQLNSAVTQTSYLNVILSWNPADFDGGSPIIDYELWYAEQEIDIENSSSSHRRLKSINIRQESDSVALLTEQIQSQAWILDNIKNSGTEQEQDSSAVTKNTKNSV